MANELNYSEKKKKEFAEIELVKNMRLNIARIKADAVCLF